MTFQKRVFPGHHLQITKLIKNTGKHTNNTKTSHKLTVYISYQLWMYYKAGTDGCCCIGVRQTLHVHSPDGNTFLCDMMSYTASISKLWQNLRNRTSSIEHTWQKNNPVKLYPNQIWNDRAWCFFWRGRPITKNKNNKMSSDKNAPLKLRRSRNVLLLLLLFFYPQY